MNLTAKLSEREQQVAEVMAFTKCKSQAADKLCISEGTLAAHSYRIYEKLEINSKSELVIWWFTIKMGIKKELIPYFNFGFALAISLGILVDRNTIYRRRITRTQNIEKCYQIASK